MQVSKLILNPALGKVETVSLRHDVGSAICPARSGPIGERFRSPLRGAILAPAAFHPSGDEIVAVHQQEWALPDPPFIGQRPHALRPSFDQNAAGSSQYGPDADTSSEGGITRHGAMQGAGRGNPLGPCSHCS